MNETLKQSVEPNVQPMMPQALSSRAKNQDGTPHFVTKGEHKFDRLTYAGLGYVANVGLSLLAVYGIERTGAGQKFMQNLIAGVKKLAPKINAKTAEWIAARSFYLTGGFAVLFPMKMLEDRKVELVKKWDQEYYGPAANDPDIEKSHRELEAAPKQSWSSIFGSRILSLIPFYATVGLVWSNKSKLAQLTNGEFRGLDKAGKEARLALADSDPAAFAQQMNKGFFFDRPIAALSRLIGKQTAQLTGNVQAVGRIEEMSKAYPAMLKEGVDKATRDPNHSALPYYFISEAITSAIVARAIYLLTRVLGPILGKDGKKTAAEPTAVPPMPVVMEDKLEHPKVKDTPTRQINTIMHQATAVQPQLEAAR